MKRLLVLLLTALAPAASAQEIGTVRIDSGLASPTLVTHAPRDYERLFITEQFGDIEIYNLAADQRNGTPFITLPLAPNGEGLQGLAFHPDYEQNGYFYVYYYRSGSTYLERYTRLTADTANPGSAFPILEVVQPRGNHNGGWIGFGPDGYLYLPLGDGGVQNDADNHAQTLDNDWLGKVLRIDVDGDDFPGDATRNYAVPPDNPFVNIAGDDEIWAYGVRNPFRSSFDRATGDFYIGDVGQDAYEEITFQPASSIGGEDYGWRLREGYESTPPPGFGGPNPDAVDPIYAYDHGSGTNEGNSVTGGYVYRGPITVLRGAYFFGNFGNSRIWSIRHDGSTHTEFMDWTDEFVPPAGQGSIDQIVGFGEDAAGNLYIVDLGGEVFQVVGPTPVPALPWALLPVVGLLFLIAASRQRAG